MTPTLLDPVDSGFVVVPGGRVHWRRFGGGSGAPVLLIHGGPGLTSAYMEPLAALADERPVYLWDQLDCGRSERPNDRRLWTLTRFVEELHSVRNALTPGPVHILGHSWGTTLALEWLVTKRPAEVASAVFAGPCLSAPRWMEDSRALIATLSPGAQAAIALAERTRRFDAADYQRTVWDEWMRTYIARTLTPEAVLATHEALTMSGANFEMLESMWGPSDFSVTGTLRDFDRTADLGSLPMPVLFLCGEFDEALPSTVHEQAAMTPKSEVVIIRGAAHLTMIDAPEETNRVIRGFLRGVDHEDQG